MNLDRQFPNIASMSRLAEKRIPRFAWDYMSHGISRQIVLNENTSRLDRVKLKPRYIVADAEQPDLTHSLFDKTYNLPFGVAPLGLSGIVWPRAAELLATSAREFKIPFALSTFATSSIEQIGAIGGDHWYQHYATVDEDINRGLLQRAQQAGFNVLLVTVDIPTATRRDHDIRNGLSVPPKFNLKTLGQILARPAWATQMLRHGTPKFLNIAPYLPEDLKLADFGELLGKVVEGHVSPARLRWYRDNWPGQMIVKGILDPADARACIDAGADAIVVSNHGGRQLDAAVTAIDALPRIRAEVGPDFPLLADGGIRIGLDIARYLALGADFVLLGRAFMFALGALGEQGPKHAMGILEAELRMTLGQLGCSEIKRLPEFLDTVE
ncbi:MAG: alpha-hydroxy acid oxidase [Pseudomonadota bacterium]